MRTIDRNRFLSILDSLDIGFDCQFPDSNQLCFKTNGRFARFWEVPEYPPQQPFFIASILAGCGQWSKIFFFPRCGCWPMPAAETQWDYRVRDVLLRVASIPAGWNGAVSFNRMETD